MSATRRHRGTGLALLAAAFAIVAVGCGGDTDGSDASADAPSIAKSGNAGSTAAAAGGDTSSIDIATYDACALTTPSDLSALGIAPQTKVQGPLNASNQSIDQAVCDRQGTPVKEGKITTFTVLEVELARGAQLLDTGIPDAPDYCAPADGPTYGDETDWHLCKDPEAVGGGEVTTEQSAAIRYGDLLVRVDATTPSQEVTPAFQSIVQQVANQLQGGA